MKNNRSRSMVQERRPDGNIEEITEGRLYERSSQFRGSGGEGLVGRSDRQAKMGCHSTAMMIQIHNEARCGESSERMAWRRVKSKTPWKLFRVSSL